MTASVNPLRLAAWLVRQRIDIVSDALPGRQVLRQFPRARFLIVGAGALGEELAALAEREGIAPAVRLLGKQPEVFLILQASDIGVLRSEFESLSGGTRSWSVRVGTDFSSQRYL